MRYTIFNIHRIAYAAEVNVINVLRQMDEE